MFKISGLDKLQRELAEAQKAFEAIDGEIGTVQFDADDPASIDAAISFMEEMIDERVGALSRNNIVGPMADEMKQKYREANLDRAAEVRLQGGA